MTGQLQRIVTSAASATLAFCCVVCATALAGDDVHEGAQLLPNPSFSNGAAGWLLRRAEASDDRGPDGHPAVILEPPPRDAWSHVGFELASVPHRRVLKFSLSLSGTAADQHVLVNAFAYGPDAGSSKNAEPAGNWSETVTPALSSWNRIELEYVVPDETTRFTLYVISQNDKPVLVADASLIVGPSARPRPSSLNGPGVIRATAGVEVRPATAGAVGTVTFPIPLLQEQQVPLTFALQVEPPGALRSCRWERRPDGVNWLCQVEVAPEAAGASVRWESLVLVGSAPERALPAAEQPEAPAEATAWLKSTACVQSADEAVIAKAEEIAAAASDVGDYVQRVIAFTSSNQGQPGAPFVTLDAAAALKCGGSCTSRANLCTALLRAHGIPARSSAHLPTWSGPLYEHWHVEYWHPGVGWVRVEPTLGKLQPQPWSMVVINIANPEDEDRSFDESMSRSHVMFGAPDLAVHRISPELRMRTPTDPANESSEAPNRATCEARLQGSAPEIAALFESARAAFARAADECEHGRPHPLEAARVEAALESGQATDLAAVLP